MKNRELIALFEGLMELKDTIMPIRTTYALLRNEQLLEPIYLTIMKCRQEIIEKYGEPQEDGQTYSIPAEKIADAQAELDGLGDVENDVILQKVPLTDLPQAAVSMMTLQAIMPIISEEE